MLQDFDLWGHWSMSKQNQSKTFKTEETSVLKAGLLLHINKHFLDTVNASITAVSSHISLLAAWPKGFE